MWYISCESYKIRFSGYVITTEIYFTPVRSWMQTSMNTTVTAERSSARTDHGIAGGRSYFSHRTTGGNSVKNVPFAKVETATTRDFIVSGPRSSA